MEHNLVLAPTKEIVALAALDSVLFCRTFLAKTFRQPMADYHAEVFSDLENENARYVGLEIFRGGAKTTILRAFTLKRVCYGASRMIMFVSASQDHSVRSVRWLKKQIDFNTRLAQVYGLERGSKWTDEYIEIRHKILDITIAVIAVGITGQTRGVNIDDYRPDLIVVDDPCDEENTGTPEQRRKVEARFFGAIEKSLTPATENPSAKMVLLQTSLHREDLINKLHKDSQWMTKKIPVFTEDGKSRWPERYPEETLKAEKQAHIERNQLLLWLREMECKIGDETYCAFRASWLKHYDLAPDRMVVLGAIDPVPPPRQGKIDLGTRRDDTDWEVLSVWGYAQGKVYLLEESASRGHTPEWTVMEFFRLTDKWRPIKWRVESIAYQRTLIWILRRAMEQRMRFVQVEEAEDRRNKAHRIVQAYSGLGSQGQLFVKQDEHEFISQFVSYPDVKHDDRLDAGAMAVDGLLNDPTLTEMLLQSDLPLGELEAVPKGFRIAP